MEVLLKRFYLNGHNVGFHPHSLKSKNHLTDKTTLFSLGMKMVEERTVLFLPYFRKCRNCDS